MNWREIFESGEHLRAAQGCTSVREIGEALGVSKDAVINAYARWRDEFDLPPPGQWSDLMAPRHAREIVREHRVDRSARVARTELRGVLAELDNAEQRLAVVLDLAKTPLPPRVIEPPSTRRHVAHPVILASDWHVEEPVRAESVNGRNRYDIDVADERVRRFFRGARWLIEHHRHSFEIKSATLALMGDLMSGYIHEELVESNGLSPTQTLLWLIERIVAGIKYLLDAGVTLDVPCNYGNHGRTTQKRRVSTGYANSYEWLMYRILEQRFEDDPRVRFSVANGDHVYQDIYGYTIRFTHGDNFKYGGGVGGLSIPLNRGVQRIENFKHADITCCGHFHQYQDFGGIVVNGSLIGYNAYALSINAGYEPPQQAFFLMVPGRGKCMMTPIWVGEEDAPA